MSEKIQKVLARLGLASRRAIETWIEEGRISVNGKKAKIGQRVELTDTISVDGERVQIASEKEPTRVILYHKPPGEICTRSDPEGRPSVFKALPKLYEGRWISVGRLDFNTTGLLLFTNDGELANRLMHPSGGFEREYAVRVLGDVTDKILDRLVKGVQLEDGKARFEDLVVSGGRGANRWFHVVVMEGRNRLVRRLWESQGLQISRLKRVRFGPIFLEASLAQGDWRDIEHRELTQIFHKISTAEGKLSPSSD